MWSLEQIKNVLNVEVLNSDFQVMKSLPNQPDLQLYFDSRKVVSNGIFLALKGETFDPHQFLTQAYENGAEAFIVHQKPDEKQIQDLILKSKVLNRPGPLFFIVQDTLKALHELATYYRNQLKCKVIAVGGSNGKTTTKEFLATLCQQDGKTHYSSGSFNNHWGVPFSILSCPQDAAYLILEMGMNHSGELAQIAQIGQADISVLTMIGVEHIEHFGTLEKIAEAEEELFSYAKKNSILVVNLDNEFTQKFQSRYSNQPQILFSSGLNQADVQFQLKSSDQKGLHIQARLGKDVKSLNLSLFGNHNVVNLMAASACAKAAGISSEKIFEGLKLCQGYWGRNQWVQSQKKFDILFDGYNSSPESLRALIDNVKNLKLKGRLFAVIGQMKELGSLSPSYHEQAGAWLTELPLQKILFLGEDHKSVEKGFLAAGGNKNNLIISDTYQESLAQSMADVLQPEDLVFVKGSRGVALERFVKCCWPIQFSDKK